MRGYVCHIVKRIATAASLAQIPSLPPLGTTRQTCYIISVRATTAIKLKESTEHFCVCLFYFWPENITRVSFYIINKAELVTSYNFISFYLYVLSIKKRAKKKKTWDDSRSVITSWGIRVYLNIVQLWLWKCNTATYMKNELHPTVISQWCNVK